MLDMAGLLLLSQRIQHDLFSPGYPQVSQSLRYLQRTGQLKSTEAVPPWQQPPPPSAPKSLSQLPFSLSLSHRISGHLQHSRDGGQV